MEVNYVSRRELCTHRPGIQPRGDPGQPRPAQQPVPPGILVPMPPVRHHRGTDRVELLFQFAARLEHACNRPAQRVTHPSHQVQERNGRAGTRRLVSDEKDAQRPWITRHGLGVGLGHGGRHVPWRGAGWPLQWKSANT